jgi:aminoglycoside/choline kinase family phosphotransferase
MTNAQVTRAGSSFPRSADELTPGWLRSVLADTDFPAASSITDIEVEIIGVGEGFLAQLARVSLQSNSSLSEQPSSLIAKFASPDESTREFARIQNVYTREIGFYRDIGDEAGVPVPRCYYSDLDLESTTFVLLLEDLAPAEPADQVAGASREQSLQVVEGFAQLHARWWNSEQLRGYTWSRPFIEEQPLADGLVLIRAAIEKAQSDGRFDRYPEMKAHLKRLPALFRLEPPSPFPYTLAHGDLRADNIFYPTAGGGRFAVIDWQLCGIDLGARDLARWLVQSISVEQRRETEQELLAHYHAQLVEHGVRGYPLSKLKNDYQLSIVVMYLMFAGGVDQFDTSAERSDALFHSMYERLDAAMVDWKVGRLLKVLPLLVPFFKLSAWFRINLARKGPPA